MEGSAVGNTFLFEREDELVEIDLFLDTSNQNKIAIISGGRGVGKSSLLHCHQHAIRPSLHTIRIKPDRLRPQAADSNQLADQLAQIIADDEKNLGFKWKKVLNDNEVDFTVLNSKFNDFHTLVGTYPTKLRPLEKAALTRKACIELLKLYSFHGSFRILVTIDDIDFIDNTLSTLLQDILNNSNITKIKILATCEDSTQTIEKLGLKSQTGNYQTFNLSRLSAQATKHYVHRLMQEYDFSILDESVD